MKNVILIAPPAAGKGTLAEMLMKRDNYISLSTGNMLKEKAKTDKELDEELKSGKLINDEVVFKCLEEKLMSIGYNPYILDGFPRTINQAIMYEDLLKKLNREIGIVIYLDVPKEELIKRITTRMICPSCKRSYSTVTKELMPQEDGICDDCEIPLIKRNDDSEETFITRYNEYLEKTSNLVHYYEGKKLLYRISAIDSEKTYEEVSKVIK